MKPGDLCKTNRTIVYYNSIEAIDSDYVFGAVRVGKKELVAIVAGESYKGYVKALIASGVGWIHEDWLVKVD